MHYSRTASVALGIFLGVFIAWGCSTDGGVQDAGAQNGVEPAITYEVFEGACSELEEVADSSLRLVTTKPEESILSATLLRFGDEAFVDPLVGNPGSPQILSGGRLVIAASCERYSLVVGVQPAS